MNGDPFREQADAYTRLSEEYTQYVERLRYAGHRATGEHDCFTMNCHGLGPQVRNLNEALAHCSSQLDIALRLPAGGTTTACPLDGVHEHAFRGPHRFHEWKPE